MQAGKHDCYTVKKIDVACPIQALLTPTNKKKGLQSKLQALYM